MSRMMHIGTLIHPYGAHPAAWRQATDPVGAGTSIEHYTQIARCAERGKLDFLFFADALALRTFDPARIQRSATFVNNLEPLTLLGALAAVTTHIGLAATVSTSYAEPFNIARQFASLDHISHGRVAWNVVTSTSQTAPFNFGLPEQSDHALRYKRAREFVEIVTGLWDSWDDDAICADAAEGRYFHPDKCHILDYRGEFFSVRGPLNIARPPQGRPVIFEAGGSDAGRQLAAETADVVFTTERSLSNAQAFYRDLKERAARCGRDPASLKILPAAHLVVGRSREEARQKKEALDALVHPEVARETVEDMMGAIDLSDLPFDQPFPVERLPKSIKGGTTYFAALVDQIVNEKPLFGDLCRRTAAARVGNVVVGDPKDIADHLESWFREGGADGFMVVPASLGSSLDDLVDLVVPELQGRGLFRRDYEGRTLRAHLGLPRPALRARPAAVRAAS